MDESLEIRIINLIRTVDQKWLSQVSQCVTEQDYDRLEILLSSESEDYRDLLNEIEDSSTDDEFTELNNEQVGAVKAVGSIARAVLDPRIRDKQLNSAIEAFENNGLLSTTKGSISRRKEFLLARLSFQLNVRYLTQIGTRPVSFCCWPCIS